MESDPSATQQKSKGYLIAGILLLFSLPLANAIDDALWYILFGGFAYCVFQFFWHRRKPSQETFSPVEKSFESMYGPGKWDIFFEDVKEIFKKRTPGQAQNLNPRQGKLVIFIVLGFIGSIFMIIILSVFLSGEVDSVGQRIQYHQALAMEYYNNQKYDSSLKYYKLAILAEPQNIDHYRNAGNCFLNLNQYDSALNLYNKVLAVQPQYAEVQYSKAYIFFDRRNYKQAVDEGMSILTYKPDYADAMLLIGDCYYNQNQLDNALEWYNKAYATGYRSAQLSHFIAYINDVKGRTSESIKYYREALSMDSSKTEVYQRLGELLLNSNPQEALWFTNKAATMKK
ncbi:MAG: tetratricopeptide repeat protein [Flammeovirgaceae bacterium]|nr:tetratricopeptide repeat protein [Flammeovirgaceae bacterium]